LGKVDREELIKRDHELSKIQKEFLEVKEERKVLEKKIIEMNSQVLIGGRQIE
jgi:hypothetical protein